MIIDLNQLRILEQLDFVNVQIHPIYEYISLANYSHKAGISRTVWAEYPLINHCRGLIFNNQTGKILAKPFKKFWNIGEPNAPVIPDNFMEVWGRPEVSIKYDGSMGILYRVNGEVNFATRGSFASEQAIKAKQIWDNKYWRNNPLLSNELTYIFEIIYPDNKIVVNYKGMEDLVLIGCIHIETGEEESYSFIEVEAGDMLHVPYTNTYTFTSLEKLLTNGVMDEGYVLFWPKQGVRVKAKKDWYVAAHRARFRLCEKYVWEIFLEEEIGEGDYIPNGPDGMDNFTVFTELFSVLDEEDQNWLINMQAEFLTRYFEMSHKVYDEFHAVEQFYNRKDQALHIQQNLPRDLWGATFALLDSRDPTSMLKKLLKPQGLGRRPTRIATIEEAG